MATLFPTRFSPPSYTTPATNRPSWPHRLVPVHTPQFLIEMLFRCVLWGRRRALQGRFDQRALAQGAENMVAAIEHTGGRVHVSGLEIVAESAAPVVFAANHMSTLETFTLPAMICPYRPVTFVVKQSLMSHFLFGPIMRALSPIAVERRDPRQDLKMVMEMGVERLGQGLSICIFPQTTRTPTFEPAKFNTLAEKLARRAGVPVIPVAVKTDFWSPGKIVKDLGRIHPERDVHITFGPPLPTDGNAKELHKTIIRFIATHLEAWSSPLPET